MNYIDLFNFIRYKKGPLDEQSQSFSNSKTIPGIRMSSGNKGAACSLLKILFEKKQVITTDLITIGELENFEDKNGNGTYKASFGHDDSIMTFVQIPFVQQSSKYKNFVEEVFTIDFVNSNMKSKWNNNVGWFEQQHTTIYDYFEQFNS